MTLQDLINWFSIHQTDVLIYFGVFFVLSLLIVWMIRPNNFNFFKYIISFLVYGVTLPGILSAILIAYSFFILKRSLLNVSFVTYFLPIISMTATLLILNSKVKMKDVPGFNRLSSLMVIISITFFLVFVLQKMHFGVFFIGGFSQLIILFIVLFVVLKLAWKRFTK